MNLDVSWLLHTPMWILSLINYGQGEDNKMGPLATGKVGPIPEVSTKDSFYPGEWG